jgi:iron complex transport system substrate-binding protein
MRFHPVTAKRRRKSAAALAVAVALMVAGCASDDNDSGGGPAPAETYSAAGVTLDKRPEKIISLSPTGTEMLFAIGAGKQVTAVDDQSTYPADAPKTDLSGFQPNAEAIAAKQPDLVIISNDINKIKDQLTALKIPVYLGTAAVTLDDTYKQIDELGALTGHRDEAGDLVGRMKDEITKLVADAPKRADKPTYFYELDPTLYTVTSKTYAGSLFAMFGLVNVADAADADGSKGGYPQMAVEAVVAADPDFIFLADTKCCQQSLDTVRSRPGWAALTAVKAGTVIALDDDVASRWGPRVVDLVRAIAGAVPRAPA